MKPKKKKDQEIIAAGVEGTITDDSVQTTEPSSGEPGEEKHKKKKKIIILIVSVFFAVVLITAAVLAVLFCMHYRDKWYIGTTINGINVSKTTCSEMKQKVLDQYREYHIDIKARNGRTLSIDEEDIDYTVSFGTEWEDLFEKQHDGSYIPFERNESYDLNLQTSYNEEKLKQIVHECAIVNGDKKMPIAGPVSARVDFDKEKMCYVVTPEIEGDTVKEDVLYAAVKEAVDKHDAVLDVSKPEEYPDMYEVPEIRSDDEGLNKEVSVRNKAVLRFVRWDITDKVSEILTPKIIMKFVYYKKGRMHFKEDEVVAWAESFYKKYYTMDKKRTFKNHAGKKVECPAGDYGWQMNYEDMLEKLWAALKKKISKKDLEKYIEDPSRDNKKAITITQKPLWKNVGFRWNEKDPSRDWDPKNYTEVSLAEQMVYVIRDGKVAFSCHCITGKGTGKKITSPGAFYIKEHQMNHVMVGEDYRIPTHYWVRITWSGIGFHPAPWQPWGAWSPGMYRYRGSHGCVNLSPKDAPTIYDMTKTKEMVFMHW